MLNRPTYFWLPVSLMTALAMLLLMPAIAAAEPRVVVSDFSSSPHQVQAGDDFKATVTLKNIGDQAATNINLLINEDTGKDSPFAPYLHSSTIPVEGTLEAGQEIQKSFRLGSSSAAIQGINNLYLTIRYQSEQDSVSGQVYEEKNTIGIPVEKTPPTVEVDRPRLSISRVQLGPEKVEVGQEFDISVQVTNSGNQRARAVQVAASHLEGSSGLNVFYPVGGSNAFAIDSLKQGNSTQKTLTFAVSPRAEARTYNLVMEMEYRDEDGQVYTSSEVVSVPVYKDGRSFVVETGPKLIIKGHRVNQSPVPAGETFDLALDIRNVADIMARNIRISVEEDENGALQTFSPVENSNVLFFPELAQGAEMTRSISLAVNPDAVSKRYNLNVKMSCEDADGKHYESSGIVSVLVKEDNVKWGPELTITSYELPSEMIESGNPFQLTLKIRNIGDEPARNVKIALNHIEGIESKSLGVFSPLGSSNTMYIEELGAGMTAAKDIRLFVSGAAQSRIYNMVVNISYQSSKVGKQGSQEEKHTLTEIIGLPVIEDRSLKIISFNYPEKVYPGEKFAVYSEFINTGNYPVENLLISFKGDFEVDYPFYYLGKFEVGGTEVFETGAIITVPGEYYGEVTFSYSNSYNQERVITKPVYVVVEPPKEIAMATAVKPATHGGFWTKIKKFFMAILGLGGG